MNAILHTEDFGPQVASGRSKRSVKALSYGGGVQTTALLRMILAGEYERPDVVIFADTGDEPLAIYAAVERERLNCEAAGLAFRVVARPGGPLRDELLKGQVRVPAFTRTTKRTTKRRKGGQLLRSCTDKFKLAPIRQFLRKHGVAAAEMWLGMSTDEMQRVKTSKLQWVTNRYPLVEMDMRRSDCEAYLIRLGIEPVKSACVYCPYHSSAAWESIRNVPEDWALAVAYDEALRDARPNMKTFVHPARKALALAVSDPTPTLFEPENDECEGVCFS